MRVTTEMVNQFAAKAGLPGLNHSSLLDYLNNTEEQNALYPSSLGKTSTANTENYKTLMKKADQLAVQSEKLLEAGADSLFEKVIVSGDTTKLYAGITDFADSYNHTLEALAKTSDGLNQYYRKMLEEAVEENRKSLEAVGITTKKDGKLEIDSESLKKASTQDIQHVLGADASLTTKTAFIAGRISSNAQAAQKSTLSQYGASGGLVSQLLSRFDTKG